MQRIRRSVVVSAPIEEVWGAVRDFNHWSPWLTRIQTSEILGGGRADVVGCVRIVHTTGGASHEQLLGLSDARHTVEYSLVESTTFALRSHLATVELQPVTLGDSTFVQWSAQFEADPGDEARIAQQMSEFVFEAGLTGLRDLFAGAGTGARTDGPA